MKRILNRNTMYLYDYEPVDNWQIVFNKLNKLYSLEDNWDGEDAIAPDDNTIRSVESYLVKLCWQDEDAPTNISASTDGVIILEFHLDGSYLEIEFNSPTEAEWMKVVDGFEPEFGQIDLSLLRNNPSNLLTQFVYTQAPSFNIQPRAIGNTTWTELDEEFEIVENPIVSAAYRSYDHGLASDELFTPVLEVDDDTNFDDQALAS